MEQQIAFIFHVIKYYVTKKIEFIVHLLTAGKLLAMIFIGLFGTN